MAVILRQVPGIPLCPDFFCPMSTCYSDTLLATVLHKAEAKKAAQNILESKSFLFHMCPMTFM